MWFEKYAWALPRGFLAFILAFAAAGVFAGSAVQMLVVIFGAPFFLFLSLWIDGFFEDSALTGVNENTECEGLEGKVDPDYYIRDRTFGEVFNKDVEDNDNYDVDGEEYDGEYGEFEEDLYVEEDDN